MTASLLAHPGFARSFAALEAIPLNPRRHLEQDARTHSEAVAAAALALAELNGLSATARALLHALALAHDIGKLGGSAKPSDSVAALEALGIEDPELLTYVKWHDTNLPWWTCAQRGQAPSDKAWRRLAAKLDVRLLCLFFVADRVDAPGGWRRNAPTTWFIAEAERRGLVHELKLDLPELPSERCAGAVWVHEGRALLIRVRAQAFELPKGGVEFDELPGEAALRELREEAGVPATLPLELGEPLATLDYRPAGYTKRVGYFRVGSPAVELDALPPGTRERRWVRLEELEQVKLVSEALRAPITRALGG